MNTEYFTQIRQTLELFKIQIEMMEELLYMAQDAYRISEKKREYAERDLEYWKERAEEKEISR